MSTVYDLLSAWPQQQSELVRKPSTTKAVSATEAAVRLKLKKLHWMDDNFFDKLEEQYKGDKLGAKAAEGSTLQSLFTTQHKTKEEGNPNKLYSESMIAQHHHTYLLDPIRKALDMTKENTSQFVNIITRPVGGTEPNFIFMLGDSELNVVNVEIKRDDVKDIDELPSFIESLVDNDDDFPYPKQDEKAETPARVLTQIWVQMVKTRVPMAILMTLRHATFFHRFRDAGDHLAVSKRHFLGQESCWLIALFIMHAREWCAGRAATGNDILDNIGNIPEPMDDDDDIDVDDNGGPSGGNGGRYNLRPRSRPSRSVGGKIGKQRSPTKSGPCKACHHMLVALNTLIADFALFEYNRVLLKGEAPPITYPCCKTRQTIRNPSFAGKGRFGEVLRARIGGVKVVLKFAVEGEERSLRHEAEIYAQYLYGSAIPAPRFYGFYKAGGGGGRGLLVLQDCGQTLPGEEFSLAHMTIVQEMLRSAHEQGVHHHDVRPCNVTVNAEGEMRLIDWGEGGPCTLERCSDTSFLE